MGGESLKIKKFIFFLFSLVTLSGCVETTALLGPVITVSSTGNIYQASLSYASNNVIYKSTGKTTLDHVNDFFKSKEDNKDKSALKVKNNLDNIKPVLEKKPEPISMSELENLREYSQDQFILF